MVKVISIDGVNYVKESDIKTEKVCRKCGKVYKKTPKESYKQFSSRKFCSNACSPR